MDFPDPANPGQTIHYFSVFVDANNPVDLDALNHNLPLPLGIRQEDTGLNRICLERTTRHAWTTCTAMAAT